MKKDKKSNGIWWKTLIVLTFVISLVCLYILVNGTKVIPQYEYETRVIELNNTNTIEHFDGEVINYLCDEGVITNIFTDKSQFYASTWEHTTGIGKGFNGKCMIKARKKI